MAQIRKADVLIADPEPIARTGLVHLVNSHLLLHVCGEAENSGSARELCARLHPSVLVLDPAMGDGLALLKDLSRWSPGTRVVIFTALHDPLSVQRAFKAGACGYVSRRDPVAAVMLAIVCAVEGKRQVGPAVEDALLDGLARGAMEMRESEAAGLSDRELQVFQLIGSGHTTRWVAHELCLSVKTVETHRQRIKGKLHLADGMELQRRAVLYVEAARDPHSGHASECAAQPAFATSS
jgi:DNA-binding NarL/FixJ family response regulator